jgi:hypothetical protein
LPCGTAAASDKTRSSVNIWHSFGFSLCSWPLGRPTHKWGNVVFDVHVTVHRDKADVHVSVHRDKFLVIEPTRCTNFLKVFILEWNSTCFGLFLCPSSVLHSTHSNGLCHVVGFIIRNYDRS